MDKETSKIESVVEVLIGCVFIVASILVQYQEAKRRGHL